ncbi:hypothetical protein C2845_PM01G45820 [Panicum miliaceum]|uniref:Uncharacterized protein n=1 Tax=Panicum miliaceum TaxID=4540 RepID=A0A3L6TK61_PANMI|nr:hypothetical protein C2845_PM01G45820 [Panicum miliaceum]
MAELAPEAGGSLCTTMDDLQDGFAYQKHIPELVGVGASVWAAPRAGTVHGIGLEQTEGRTRQVAVLPVQKEEAE